MDNICICSNKNPPEYWNVSLIILQDGSPGCRLGWRLVLRCLLGVPLGSILVESEGKKWDRAEGKVKLHHWPDDLT